MIPSAQTVLSWRWGVRTVLRLGALGVIVWTLWTWVPILVAQFIIAPMNGRSPFSYLDASVATAQSAVNARQTFYLYVRQDTTIVVVTVVLALTSGWLARLVVRFPRALTGCPVCRYSLKDLAAARCPECGLDLPEGAVDRSNGASRPGPTRPAPPDLGSQ